jgi:hypothetical protein
MTVKAYRSPETIENIELDRWSAALARGFVEQRPTAGEVFHKVRVY